MISVIVERAQGTDGQVEVEWRTSDITARSSGKTPIDYQVRLKCLDQGQRGKPIDFYVRLIYRPRVVKPRYLETTRIEIRLKYLDQGQLGQHMDFQVGLIYRPRVVERLP